MHDKYYMSNLENPRFTEWTSTSLERSHRLPHICTKMIYGKLGGYRLQENEWSTWLRSGGCASYLIRDSELSEEVLLEEVLANLFFPTTSMDSQLVGQPLLHSHSIASSPAPRAYKPECYGRCQLSWPLQARTFARKNASLSISIYLSVYLAS